MGFALGAALLLPAVLPYAISAIPGGREWMNPEVYRQMRAQERAYAEAERQAAQQYRLAQRDYSTNQAAYARQARESAVQYGSAIAQSQAAARQSMRAQSTAKAQAQAMRAAFNRQYPSS